jgi:pyruvate dehydrogenase E2 component (dihydrolipoamide acetyltransferase)
MADSEGLDLAQIPGSGPGGQVTRADVARLLAAGRGKVRATPAARRIAREQQVPLEQVAGSGPRGRIQGRDVLAYQAAPHTTTAPEPAAGDWTVVPFEGMRRTIAERMVASYQSAPHITFTARVDFTEFEAARARLNQRAEREDAPRFSVTALLVQLAARALRSHPMLNARLVNTAEQTEIHLMHAVNIGVAVALPEGLIVPVVRDADRKAGREIAAEVQQLAAKARDGRLAPGDVVGGTFTISNLGPFGVEQFTAILNPGQTGILAVGAAVREPVAVGNEVQIRPMVHLTLAVDHRVVDGAVAAHFLADLRALLETPSLVLW